MDDYPKPFLHLKRSGTESCECKGCEIAFGIFFTKDRPELYRAYARAFKQKLLDKNRTDPIEESFACRGQVEHLTGWVRAIQSAQGRLALPSDRATT